MTQSQSNCCAGSADSLNQWILHFKEELNKTIRISSSNKNILQQMKIFVSEDLILLQ